MIGIHIHCPPGYYIGQVKRAGAQKWDTVTGKRKTMQSALAGAAKHMQGNLRLRVLFCADYYDPVISFEGRR